MLYVNPVDSRYYAATNVQGPAPSEEAHALQEFERVFAYQFVREMRKSVPDSPLFGSSTASAYFQDMLDDLWAGEMAQSGQLGIADQIQSQWRAQEAAKKVHPAGSYLEGIPMRPEGGAQGIPLGRQTPPLPLGNQTQLSPTRRSGQPMVLPPREHWFKLQGATADIPSGPQNGA